MPPQRRIHDRLGVAVGIVALLESLTYLLAAAAHAGVSIGIAEPPILPAAIAEGVIGVVLVVAALAVLARSDRAWAAAVTAHAIAVAGVLLGMAALALGQGPRTEANDLYHRVMLVVAVAVLVFLLTSRGRAALGRRAPSG